jgi:hypothetical protein
MRRRDVLLGGGAAVAANTAPCSVFEVFGASANRLVDAHCHIFNADDLPIVGFVEKAVISGHSDFQVYVKQYGDAIDFFVRYLAQWLRGKAVPAVDEITKLNEIENKVAAERSPSKIRLDEIDALSNLISELMGKYKLGRNVRLGDRIVAFYVPGTVIGYMHREAFPNKFTGPNGANPFDRDQWSSSDELAKAVYDRGSGPVTQYLKWGLLYTRSRFELVNELDRIHAGRARLLMPALVDYTYWLNDEYDVKLADQVKVMERISRRPKLVRVHGYAPFDPLREALHRRSGSTVESALDIAKDAVGERGFIGVKLYPTMGFLPLGNSDLLAKDFPPHLRQAFPGHALGEALDGVLRDLYAWCKVEEVPIMAHCSDSYGADPSYTVRGSPESWNAALKDYPGLRLNLAHFNDFDKGFATKNHPMPKLSETWEWKMAKLIQDHPTSLVFADLSYSRRVLLGRDDNERKEVVRMLTAVKGEFSLLSSRLLFGTDWTLYGQEAAFVPFGHGGQYAEKVRQLLIDAKFSELEIDGIMFMNVGKLLGLDQVQSQTGNRIRLKQFYRGFDATWLDQFLA